VAIRDDRVDFVQSPLLQIGEEILPRQFILTIGDPRTEDLPEPITPYPGDHQECFVDVTYSVTNLEV